jgi:acyl-CoA thioester hydrolase
MMFVSRSTFRARYSETDQMGIIHHPQYLVWCEIGRTDYIREFGASYAELERAGLLLAVAEVGVRYVASARYDELIMVETMLERVQSRALTFAYRIYRDEPAPRTLLATATTKLVATTRAGATRLLPADLLEKFRNAVVSNV